MSGRSGMPGAWAICATCEGHGHHARDFGAITADEWHGPDWDDDSRDAYMRGDYDKACEACDGSGKVWGVNVARCSFAQKRELVLERRSARWAEEARAERQREAWMMGERE